MVWMPEVGGAQDVLGTLCVQMGEAGGDGLPADPIHGEGQGEHVHCAHQFGTRTTISPHTTLWCLLVRALLLYQGLPALSFRLVLTPNDGYSWKPHKTLQLTHNPRGCPHGEE